SRRDEQRETHAPEMSRQASRPAIAACAHHVDHRALPAANEAWAFQFAAFTPTTSSQSISTASPMIPGAMLYGRSDAASDGKRKVSHPRPAIIIKMPIA